MQAVAKQVRFKSGFPGFYFFPTQIRVRQNFFSLGGGWLMTEEEFMKDIKWLDMLKLKASYGTLGNQLPRLLLFPNAD